MAKNYKYNLESFEDFLQEKHIEAEPQVLDDDLPDAFDAWLGEMDGETYIGYADEYGDLKFKEGYQKAIDDLPDADYFEDR